MAAKDASFEEVSRFHGHVCPGLAIGYRMARAGMEALADERAEDEELVAVVENDACGVDAVQYLTGCTFGKGNLIFRDYGKQVVTLHHRASGKAVRITPADSPVTPVTPAEPSETGRVEMTREERTQWLLDAPDKEVVSVEGVSDAAPGYARIRASVDCAFCGERVMETRARIKDGKTACIPCSEGEGLASGG